MKVWEEELAANFEQCVAMSLLEDLIIMRKCKAIGVLSASDYLKNEVKKIAELADAEFKNGQTSEKPALDMLKDLLSIDECD
ncbi:hypothetical protein Mpt1_c04260 [Candidatus Methanoplasma termitum]|uniref:Uncharacterized protein n=1 Tax=Candidatus Methanoplasma termitum TaxID=1577791 RepID=A0A0A7LAX6_9ARCH|nr:hypothetical protein [Candidatus Methanoplasma termitum]AIZ56320.1 hypothetical protein Mpt1_c04260 [Candidatus Methanoplasma termitum]MCL2334311.1 hypothetical protein [Candidatus Methanoplasma sp.]